MMKVPVLLLDARETESTQTSQALAAAGFAVVCAPTAQAALVNCGNADPRMAVIELDSLALEVGAAAGLKVRWPHLAVVALAKAQRGKTDTEMLAGARTVGAHAFLVHPVAPADLARRLDELARQGYGLPGRRRTVLVVDDSETVGEMMRTFLKKNGFNAVVKTTWEAALSGWDTLGIDLVFTDIFMPGMGGVEGIRHARANWSPVPIVAFSEGLGGRMESDQALLAAQKIGADATLAKPLDEAKVMALVRQLLPAPELRHASA
jgi:DNA-binding response OmpR family regulator